ncbi:MAG TPA: substrate-binding domain-containing protein [Acidisoma sp.]|nr:substrate-binding domain-containing protein [Acidisoma sp.]
MALDGRVTLRTVADHLGLSPTTVSRALKRGDDVNADTIDKVEAAARALGYRPHLGGINLRTGRTHAIGIILPLGGEGDVNKFVASLIEGVSSFLKTIGYRTAVVPLLRDDDPIIVLKELVSENSVDGIILTNTKPQDERVKWLLQTKTPFITFGRTELFSPHAFVDVDHERIGARAGAMMFDAGHSQPLLIAPPEDLTYSMQFRRGWAQIHRERGVDLAPQSVICARNSSNAGLEIASSVLRDRPEITGAFIAHDDTAMGFVSGLRPFGKHVGEDFGIITYGGTRMHSFINPPLSAFTFPHVTTGQSLARLLIKLIQGGRPEELQEVSQADFNDLGSHHLTAKRL